MTDELDWISQWYLAQCDGDWEHSWGPVISTIDNPGWSIEIALTGTDCDGRTMEQVTHNYEHETAWWTCRVEDNVFKAAGGPLQLRSMLAAFRDWATRQRADD